MSRSLFVSISAPKHKNLSKVQRHFIDGLEDCLHDEGLRILNETTESDDVESRLRKIHLCQGVIVVGFRQWEAQRLYRQRERRVFFPSEFTHIESVIAMAANRPLLVFREKDLSERGVLRSGYLPHVIKMPRVLDRRWLADSEFTSEFKKWVKNVRSFRHIFLGYSSRASDVASRIRKFLTETLGYTVFDWQDFLPGDTIWGSIERAAGFTTCGIFLFMADDRLGSERVYTPRNNVVYEAGYFAGAKGRKYAVIIAEDGTQIPTDLGDLLYLRMANRNNIAPIEGRLRGRLQEIFSELDDGH